MKKLSFIMAVLMILMCMPIMAISAADEVVAPDANAPETVTNNSATYGENYVFYQYASDEEAIADGAIGRFTKEGGNGYAKTFFAVGAEAGVCGANVFYLLTDYVWSDGAKRIGSELGLDMGASGRSVIVDGSLGQTMSSSKENFKLQNTAGRVIHYGSNPKGTVTFRNLSIIATGNSAVQVNNGASSLIFENVNVNATNNTAFVCGGNLKLINCNVTAANHGVHIHQAGANLELIDSNVNAKSNSIEIANPANVVMDGGYYYGGAYALRLASGDVKIRTNITVYDGQLDCGTESRSAFQMNKGLVTANIYGGIYEAGFGFVVNTDIQSGSVFNIYGGTFNAKVNHGMQCQSANAVEINIHGGTWMAAKQIINVSKGTTDINITGGSFAGNNRMIRLNNGNTVSTLNVSGGTFLAKNFDIPMNQFSSTPTPETGLIFTQKNSKVNISGGSFTVYKDNGITLATDCAFVYSWKESADYNPSATVTGGIFNGGKCFLADAVYSGDKKAPIDEAKSTFYYYTEGTNGVTLEPKATQGASVRLDKNSSGLRFTATIDALAIKFIEENLVKEGTTLSYGTMIVPSNYVKYAGGELTMEAFDKAGKAYLNIEAKDGVIVNEDGSVTINAAMVNIKKENYDRDFIAVAYIKYTDKTGAEVIKYATNVTLAAFSRNVQEVAHAALADVLTTSAGTYTNKVDGYYVWNQNARKYEYVTGTAYSRYNAEQLAVLKSYIIAE